jgi:cephalosporin hydroxylase
VYSLFNIHSYIIEKHRYKTKTAISDIARFQIFTAVKIQVEVFWVVTPYSVAVGYQRFGGSYIHFALKIEAGRSSETLVSDRTTVRCHNPETSTSIYDIINRVIIVV